MPSRSKLLLFCCLLALLFTSAIALPAHSETFRNPRRIPLSVDPSTVATGDLNGDGRNDIVWAELPASPGAAKLHVLLAGADGQYTPAPDLGIPFTPTMIHCILEDVTGDSRNDLVCVAPSNNYTDVFLIAYRGRGDGTFLAPVQTRITAQPTFLNPFLGRAGDLNKDGLSDLIVMNAQDSGIVPYLSDGQGGFRASSQFQGSFNYSVPTVTDLNGDGKPDVLWPTGPRVNLGNGDGTFSAIAQYDPGYLSNCAFGDVDGDGRLDAACTWYDGPDIDGYIHLTVLHGNGDGSFSKTPLFTRTFGTGETLYDGLPTIYIPVLVADLNGDGFADIVSLSGDGYCVLPGGANSTWNGQPQQFVTSTLQSEAGLKGIYGVSMADMNGDGLPDIVAIGPNGLYITYAQHDGTLSSAPAVEVGQVSTSATLADFDGDGNLDVVSAGDTALKLSLGRGDGTFRLPQPITTAGNFGRGNYVLPGVISGDFNGDGKQDLLATGSTGPYASQTYILFGRGGTFDAPQPVAIALGKVADLNNDGRSDVFAIRPNGNAEVLIANLSRGDGTFTTVSSNLPADAGPFGPAVGDFRHSGLLDAAVASMNSVYLLRGHGDGTFDSTGAALAIPDLPNLNKAGVFDLASGDFDKDGNLDIAVLSQYGSAGYNGSTPTSAAWVFYGRGDGTFSAAVLAGTFNRDAQTLSAGDLNGDGLADLVLTSYNVYQDTGVLVVHALPNRTWGPEIDYTGGEGLSPLWITDINHDGRNDLIFSNAQRANLAANSVSVLLNQAEATVTGSLTASPAPSYVGQPFTARAVLIPDNPVDTLTGNVTFSFNGSVVGTAPLSGNTATVTVSGTGVPAGIYGLSAYWPGNGTYPAVTLSTNQVVDPVPLQILLSSSANPSATGQSVTFSVQLQALPLPGLVAPAAGFTAALSFYDGNVLLGTQTSSSGVYSFTTAALLSGVHAISASYPGDATFASIAGNLSQTVNGLAVSMLFSANPNPAAVGSAVTLIAQVASAGNCAGCAFNANVQFSDGGVPLGSAPVNANGIATLPVTFAAAGPHALLATYPGDSSHAAASATLTEQVVRADAALTLTPSATPVTVGTPVTFTAHLASAASTTYAGLFITFSDGASVFATAPVSAAGTASATLSNLSLGTHTITAALAQTAAWNAASASVTEVVTKAPTAIVLSGSPNPVSQNQTLTLHVTLTTPAGVPATGSVRLLDGILQIAAPAIASNTAAFSTSALTVGTHTLTAIYDGDANTLPVTSAPLVITVPASDFTLTCTPPAITLQTAHHLTLSVTAQSVGDFADRLTFSTTAAPAHMTIALASPTMNLASGGSGVLSVYLDTDDVRGYARLEPTEGPHTHRSSPLWALVPVPFLLSFLRRGTRRWRNTGLIMLALSVGLLSGCSSVYPKSTAPGTYTIQIQAAGIASGVAHTVSLQVNVQP